MIGIACAVFNALMFFGWATAWAVTGNPDFLVCMGINGFGAIFCLGIGAMSQ